MIEIDPTATVLNKQSLCTNNWANSETRGIKKPSRQHQKALLLVLGNGTQAQMTIGGIERPIDA